MAAPNDHPERSPNLPSHGELSWRFTVLMEEWREARALGEKERAKELRREARGVFKQLQQSWQEPR